MAGYGARKLDWHRHFSSCTFLEGLASSLTYAHQKNFSHLAQILGPLPAR